MHTIILTGQNVSCGVPQGSVLGPVLFSLYTTQLGRVIDRYGLGRQLFADDSGLYDSFSPERNSITNSVERIESCCRDIKSWMSANMLKLNEGKTEAILCGPQNKRPDLNSVTVCDAVIPFSSTIRDLGLHLDRGVTLEDHISAVVKGCYFHLRSLGKLRPSLTVKAATAIAVALVLSRLDYCNSCLWGLPDQQLKRLQMVMNTAARIVTRTKRNDHITPVLKELHWLPVKQRIDHKVLSLVYKCVNGTAPVYLQDIVQQHAPQRQLRSASQSRLRIPSFDENRKKSLGFRAFRNAAPKLWNILPQSLKNSPSTTTFKKRLKTHLFSNL